MPRRERRDLRGALFVIAVVVLGVGGGVGLFHNWKPAEPKLVGFHVPWVPPVCRDILATPRAERGDGWTGWRFEGTYPRVAEFRCGHGASDGVRVVQPVIYDFAPRAP